MTTLELLEVLRPRRNTNLVGAYLIAELPHLPSRAQHALASCVPYLLQQPSAQDAELILSLPETHPAYEPTRYLREAIPLDSPQAQRSQKVRDVKRDAEAKRNA